MNSENIKKVTNQAIEKLITALNEGRSETLTQYLAAIGRFHRYSLGNVMLIASQRPTATHVAGFHAWHRLGRFVKKGEKGILILAPIVRHKNENAEQTDTDESSTAVGFRAAYVFDISQTDGQALPTIGSVNGNPWEYRECLAKFVAEQGIALEYSEDIAPARGTSAGGKITLMPGQSPAEEFATLAHEVAHEMMHRDERRGESPCRAYKCLTAKLEWTAMRERLDGPTERSIWLVAGIRLDVCLFAVNAQRSGLRAGESEC
jgi:antirestriction protein ArdC